MSFNQKMHPAFLCPPSKDNCLNSVQEALRAQTVIYLNRVSRQGHNAAAVTHPVGALIGMCIILGQPPKDGGLAASVSEDAPKSNKNV